MVIWGSPIVRNLHINIPSWMDVWRKTQYFMGVQIDMSRCKICRVRNCGWWQAVVFDTKAQGSKYGKAYPVKCFKNLCLNQQTLIRISRCCNPHLVGGFKPPTSHGFLWVSKMTQKSADGVALPSLSRRMSVFVVPLQPKPSIQCLRSA